jgi:GNAT superfamily N-acetyltransferase
MCVDVDSHPSIPPLAGVVVRRIRPDEGLRLRTLRLRALADAPMAFGSTLREEAGFAEEIWHSRASRGASEDDRATFVAERSGDWVGIATGLAQDPDGGAGAVLVGMFVAPEARRVQVGMSLVKAVIGWAQARGERQLRLWVTDTNAPALALYRRAGFRPTGRSRPVPHTPSLSELEMIRDVE